MPFTPQQQADMDYFVQLDTQLEIEKLWFLKGRSPYVIVKHDPSKDSNYEESMHRERARFDGKAGKIESVWNSSVNIAFRGGTSSYDLDELVWP